MAPSFDELQRQLGARVGLNRAGGTVQHTVVALPSFSVGESMLSHYADRIPALEHRFLVAVFMLGRLPASHFVFVASRHPEQEVVDHYLRLMSADANDVRRRLDVVVVDDASARAVAAKLLDAPDVLARIRACCADRPAFIEPWNVGPDEVAVAEALGMPLNGAAPHLAALGYKSAGRVLMRETGVAVPFGIENVSSVQDVVDAIEAVVAARPDAPGVVVKLDNSGAGDGNMVVDLRAVPTDPSARRRALELTVTGFPAWYLTDLRQGGIVEERIAGAEFTSPSVQIDIGAAGEVTVLATHDQELGGDNGQVYLGCRMPADPAYAPQLADFGMRIGRRLAAEGVVGRSAIDFVAARDDGADDWRVFAIEINLRKGGTSHPYSTLRNLAPGRYDAATAQWVCDDGSTRCYSATDNLLDERWMALTAGDAIAAVEQAGLQFDPARRTGVVLHMLSCLPIDGRCGVIAIAATPAEADDLRRRVRDALDNALTR